MTVPRDNVRELRIGEKEYQLEASLGTAVAYRNEFFGKLDEPYRGILADDMLQVWRRSQETVEDEGGNEAPNPDFYGYDVEALLRIAWSMAWAAGSTKKRYAKFYDEVIHQPAGLFEEASLYNTVVMELGGGIIFRRPEGQGGAGQADEAGETQEG